MATITYLTQVSAENDGWSFATSGADTIASRYSGTTRITHRGANLAGVLSRLSSRATYRSNNFNKSSSVE